MCLVIVAVVFLLKGSGILLLAQKNYFFVAYHLDLMVLCLIEAKE